MMLSPVSVWAENTQTVVKKVTESIKNQKSSGIEQQYFDSSIRANDDFYQHVNGLWLKNTEIPSDKARWGTFDILREQSTQQLHDIIQALSTQHIIVGSAEQKVADLYASFMDEKTINALGIQPIQAELDHIDTFNDKKDFAKIVAYLSKIGIPSPFDVGITQDAKDSTKMIVAMGQSGLGLPDRDYYLKHDEKFKQIRTQYVAYIEKMLSLSGDLKAKQHAKDILKLETQIAQVQWSNVQNRDAQKTYNIYKVEDLAQLSPDIHWQDYLTEQELIGKIQTIQVVQPSYFKDLSPIVAKISVDTWKAYFKLNTMRGFAPLLSQQFIDVNFDFYSKTLRGIKQQKPRWKRGIDLTDGNLGESLGQLYVKKYFTADKKQRMEQLVQNLLKAYAQSVDQLDWMSPATKVEAKKKIASFMVKIGYPNKWRDYSTLEIKKDDLVGNVLRSREFSRQFELNKLGKPVDREEWGMTPQTVNAYYNASLNEIVFPAAILQPPFFDMNADDAVNYGGIGAVIGHEMSHGFDDQGSQFDDMGNMKNWWTDEDRRKFKEKTQALVQQYSAYEPVKGYHVNGELTLGENIADNSGLAIAYKAYQLSLNGQPASVIDGFTGEQRFYIGWAQVWRGKITDPMQIEFIKRDPHSPDEVRGNATLKNQTHFYDAFVVKEADKMYLPKNKRVTIW